MDNFKVNRIDNNSLKPINSMVPKDETTNDEVIAIPEVDPTQEENSLNSTISPLNSPALFSVFRKAVLNTELVSNFIKQNTKKIGDSSKQNSEGNLTNYLRRAIRPDKQFESEIQKKLSGIPFSLTEDLKRRIHSTDLLFESAVMLKMLFCLEDKDEIVHQLMIPYLEERSGLGDNNTVQSNKRFYLRFLKALHEKDLEEILLNLHYQEIIRADNFAYALLEVAEPKLILDSLKKHQINFNLPPEEKFTAIEKIQMIQLTLLQNETARGKLKDEVVQYLETLYLTSNNKRVSDDVAKILLSNYVEAGKGIFLKQLEETTDTVEETVQIAFTDTNEEEGNKAVDNASMQNKKRCYLAVNHLVNAINNDSEAANYLKGFILKEKDQFVLGNAVYLLANNLGEPGKQALVEVITEQVKNEITSLPLACLNILYISKGQNVYLNLIKEILNSDYKGTGTLRSAFETLKEEYLYSSSLEDNSDFLFTPINKQEPEQVIDLIKCIGPETFFSWVLQKENKALQRNAEEILNYACELNPEIMYSLAISTLINEPTATTELTKKLSGMGEVDTFNEVVNKIYTYHLRN